MRRWEKIPAAPPDDVVKVKLSNGSIFTRDGDAPGYYWVGPGWPNGVAWNTLRQWGDVEEVTFEAAEVETSEEK